MPDPEQDLRIQTLIKIAIMKKEQIIGELTESHNKFTDYILSLNEVDFSFSFQHKWTAGQQIDHIVRSISGILTAFIFPRFFVRLLFGRAKRYSATYENLVKAYQAKLEHGAKASRIFVPGKINFSNRNRLVDKLKTNVLKLNESISKFSEEELDSYMLPHPILGKLTMREMMYFVIYHVKHHHRFTKQNLDK
jgi:hypothetical protein